MDILYLGQKPIGERIFFSLILPFMNKNLIVCSNKNKSNWWNSNKIYNYCRINKINFIDNCKRNENLIIKFIKSNKINCILSVQHKWILSKKIIDSVDGNAFNLHLASLPEYKGSCGLNIALLNNKKSINATLHLLTKEVDNGPIIYQKSVRISSVDNAWTLYKKLEEAGFKIFEKLLTNIKNKKISFLRRNEKKGKFYNYSSLDKFRVIQSKEINNDTFVRSRALSFKNFKPLIIKNKKINYFLSPEIIKKKYPITRVSKKLINRYRGNDVILKIIKMKSKSLEKKLYCQKWLSNDLNKRFTFFKNYYDLLEKKNLKILDVGGALTVFTRILSEIHSFTLCEIFNYETKKQINYFKKTKIINSDWISHNFGFYDIVIANDLFPNVDQRLELFLLKVLPHCKELRISLTIDNNENYYNVKRVEGNELMCLKGMNGESVYNILKKYLININQLNLDELNYNEDSPWDNGRQVFLLKIKGYLN